MKLETLRDDDDRTTVRTEDGTEITCYHNYGGDLFACAMRDGVLHRACSICGRPKSPEGNTP